MAQLRGFANIRTSLARQRCRTQHPRTRQGILTMRLRMISAPQPRHADCSVVFIAEGRFETPASNCVRPDRPRVDYTSSVWANPPTQ